MDGCMKYMTKIQIAILLAADVLMGFILTLVI